MLGEEPGKPWNITLYSKPSELETSTTYLMYDFHDFLNESFELRFLMHVFDVTWAHCLMLNDINHHSLCERLTF